LTLYSKKCGRRVITQTIIVEIILSSNENLYLHCRQTNKCKKIVVNSHPIC